MKYTILLLYPSYLAGDDFGRETYLAHVVADDIKSAEREAQLQALRSQSDKTGVHAKDFFVLFAAEGKISDCRWRLQK